MNAEKHGTLRHTLADALVVAGPRGESRLGPVLAALWQAADGKSSIATLLAAVRKADRSADEALVWQGLDTLADAGLLRSRIAPPGTVIDRRALLLGMAVVPLRSRAAGVGNAASEEARKLQLSPAEARQQEQGDKLLGTPDSAREQEQNDKLTSTPEAARRQEQGDKLLGDQALLDQQAARRKQEQNDKLLPTQ